MNNEILHYKTATCFYCEIYATGVHDGVLRAQIDRGDGAEARAHIRHQEHGEGRGTEEGVQPQVPDESNTRIPQPRGLFLYLFSNYTKMFQD